MEKNENNILKCFEIYQNYIKLSESPVNSAVAITYNADTDNAPVIIAKGKDILARKMINLAKKYDIPIVSDESSIYDLMKVNIGGEIPYFMYEAISVILAHVYRLSNDK